MGRRPRRKTRASLRGARRLIGELRGVGREVEAAAKARPSQPRQIRTGEAGVAINSGAARWLTPGRHRLDISQLYA